MSVNAEGGLEINIEGGRRDLPRDQYGRKFQLIIGPDTGDALELSAFRCVFRVERGDVQTPNSCRVRVYNVRRETASRAMKEFKRLVLFAGYEGNFGVLFDGTIIQTRFGRESATDTYMDITAADGDFAVISATLAAGSTVPDHVAACMKAMEKHGVTLGYTPEFSSKPLPRGKVMAGMVRDYMRSIAKNTKSSWSIQNGKVQIVPETSYVPGQPIAINSKSGMVGYPVQTQNGVTVRTLLNPYIKVSQLIHLDNRAVQEYEYSLDVEQQAQNDLARLQNTLGDGYYYVMVSTHWGDTRGNDWYTEAVCLSANATIAADYVRQGVAAPAGVVVVPPYP